MRIAIFLVITLTISACGKKESSSSNGQRQQDELSREAGLYRAVLKPLNQQVTNHNAFGTAIIRIQDDEFNLKLNIINAPSGAHYQSIHAAKGCPQTEQDKNKDSYLDVLEGLSIFGKTLIPLDSDLSAQDSGNDFSPSTHTGSYSYLESTSLNSLLKDLSAPDPIPGDNVIKLRPREPLNLAGRTFVVLGVPETARLPETVGTFQQLPREATLPIACGEIVRIVNEDQ